MIIMQKMEEQITDPDSENIVRYIILTLFVTHIWHQIKNYSHEFVFQNKVKNRHVHLFHVKAINAGVSSKHWFQTIVFCWANTTLSADDSETPLTTLLASLKLKEFTHFWAQQERFKPSGSYTILQRELDNINRTVIRAQMNNRWNKIRNMTM